MSLEDRLLVFSGTSNPPLTDAICRYLGTKQADASVARFPDGEISVKIQADVRGADVYVIQSTCTPVNDNLMELLTLIDALRRASANTITAVIPYFGYARQDRKDEGRVPISAKLVANLITQAGANRVLTIDLHAAQIQGFFDIPLDHIYASPVLVRHFKRLGLDDLVICSPDVGGMKMAWGYAKRLGARLAVVEKRRVSPTKVEAGFVIGDVAGRNVVLVDDIVATGGSVAEAATVLLQKQAASVSFCVTHPVMCGKAVENLGGSELTRIVTTDTIPLGEKAEALGERLTVLSVADLLGEAIHRIHSNRSVSYLFNLE